MSAANTPAAAAPAEEPFPEVQPVADFLPFFDQLMAGMHPPAASGLWCQLPQGGPLGAPQSVQPGGQSSELRLLFPTSHASVRGAEMGLALDMLPGQVPKAKLLLSSETDGDEDHAAVRQTLGLVHLSSPEASASPCPLYLRGLEFAYNSAALAFSLELYRRFPALAEAGVPLSAVVSLVSRLGASNNLLSLKASTGRAVGEPASVSAVLTSFPDHSQFRGSHAGSSQSVEPATTSSSSEGVPGKQSSMSTMAAVKKLGRKLGRLSSISTVSYGLRLEGSDLASFVHTSTPFRTGLGAGRFGTQWEIAQQSRLQSSVGLSVQQAVTPNASIFADARTHFRDSGRTEDFRGGVSLHGMGQNFSVFAAKEDKQPLNLGLGFSNAVPEFF